MMACVLDWLNHLSGVKIFSGLFLLFTWWERWLGRTQRFKANSTWDLLLGGLILSLLFVRKKLRRMKNG